MFSSNLFKGVLGVTMMSLMVTSLLNAQSAQFKNDLTMRRIQNTTKVGGYFDTELFLYDGAGKNDTFKAHRYIMSIGSQIHEKISAFAEIEYEYGAAINSLGDQGELKIEQAYLDYSISDELVFRGGIILSPMSFVNRFHDSDLRDTTARPILTRYILPSTWMDSGFGFHGEVELNEDWELSYESYIMNGLASATGNEITSSKGIRSTRPNFKQDNNSTFASISRVNLSPGVDLDFGASYYTGAYDDLVQNNMSILGLEAQYRLGAAEIIAEYGSVDIEGHTISNMNGYYVEGRYHFFPDFLKGTFFADGFDHPTFTAFARIGGVDLDADIDKVGEYNEYLFGLNYRPIESTVFKIEYQMNTDINSGSDSTKEYNALITSVAVSF